MRLCLSCLEQSQRSLMFRARPVEVWQEFTQYGLVQSVAFSASLPG